jgi:hypothetical protein
MVIFRVLFSWDLWSVFEDQLIANNNKELGSLLPFGHSLFGRRVLSDAPGFIARDQEGGEQWVPRYVFSEYPVIPFL